VELVEVQSVRFVSEVPLVVELNMSSPPAITVEGLEGFTVIALSYHPCPPR
jgi:hypothetical protein